MTHSPTICHVNLAKGFRGGERQTQILIQTLAEAGVNQVLLARANSPLHDALSGTRGLTQVGAHKPYIRAIPEIHGFKPSIVHAHDAKAAQWALCNWWIHKTPYLITRRVPNTLGRNIFTRAVYRNAAALVALSGAIKHCINELEPSVAVNIIPSMYASFSIDENKVRQLRTKYAGKFVVGHIGALVDRHKGQAVIINAAKLLAGKHPDMHFVLLGEGEDEHRFKAMAKGLSNIEFTGFVSDVGTWIAAFDLFVFPSYQEGLGSTLLDVMQGSCPIIASATDGILDVIEHEVNGLLVSAGNPEKLAEAIEKLYLDSNMREQLVLGGQERLGRYSPQRVTQRYLALYMDMQGSQIRP